MESVLLYLFGGQPKLGGARLLAVPGSACDKEQTSAGIAIQLSVC
jgi:hypothetical protein